MKDGNGNTTKKKDEFDDSQADLKIISKDRFGSKHLQVWAWAKTNNIRVRSNKDTSPVIKSLINASIGMYST